MSSDERPDGCTGIQWMIPKGDSFPWQHCCEEHDYAYIERSLTRKQADLNFLRCVRESGHPAKAMVMYGVIRAMGWVLWHDIDKSVKAFFENTWRRIKGNG